MSTISIHNGDNCTPADVETCAGDDAIIVQRGQCLDISMTWEGLDTTGMAVSVIEASHPVLMEMVITPVDTATGQYKIYLTPEGMAQLPDGRLSWFRFELNPNALHPSGTNRVTPKAWINIQ